MSTETHGGRRSYGETDQDRGAVPPGGVRAQRGRRCERAGQRRNRPVRRRSKGAKGFKGRYVARTSGPGLAPPKGTKKATPEEIGLGAPKRTSTMDPGRREPGLHWPKGKQVNLVRANLKSNARAASVTARWHQRGPRRWKRRSTSKAACSPKNRKQKCSTHDKEVGEIETKTTPRAAHRRPAGKEPLITYAHKKAGVAAPKNRGSNSNAKKRPTWSPGRSTGKSTSGENTPSKKSGLNSPKASVNRALIATFPNPFNERRTRKRTGHDGVRTERQARGQLRAPAY